MGAAAILGVAQLFTSVLGGGLQIFEGIETANNLRRNAHVNRKLADNAAKIGKLNANQIRQMGTQAIGGAQASYGRAGLAATGSLLDVIQRQEFQYELDAQKAIYQGELEAAQFRFTANQQQFQARQAFRNGILGGATSILGGGVNFFGGQASGPKIG